MFKKIIAITVVIGCFFNYINAQHMGYDYENWPGKNGVVKSNIELSRQFISKHNITFTREPKGKYFHGKVPFGENDSLKMGRLQIQVFPNIEEAQLGLVNYLNFMATPFKPPRLTNEDFKAGDVAFGKEYNGMLRMCFTRNNVLVIVHAQMKKGKAIALEIDGEIISAPEWKESVSKPLFLLTE